MILYTINMPIKAIKKIFKNFSKNKKSLNTNISISNQALRPKVVLIIFPIDKEFFRVASYTYRNLPYTKNETVFHYIINDNFSDSFSLRKALRNHEINTIVLASLGGLVMERLNMAGSSSIKY